MTQNCCERVPRSSPPRLGGRPPQVALTLRSPTLATRRRTVGLQECLACHRAALPMTGRLHVSVARQGRRFLARRKMTATQKSALQVSHRLVLPPIPQLHLPPPRGGKTLLCRPTGDSPFQLHEQAVCRLEVPCVKLRLQ